MLFGPRIALDMHHCCRPKHNMRTSLPPPYGGAPRLISPLSPAFGLVASHHHHATTAAGAYLNQNRTLSRTRTACSLDTVHANARFGRSLLTCDAMP